MYRVSLLVFLVFTLAVHEVELRLCDLSVNQWVPVMREYTPAGGTTKSANCIVVTNYCQGGCTTKFKFDSHVYGGSSTPESSRYCSSATMKCCKRQGPTETKTHDLLYCSDADDYTIHVPVSSIVGGPTVTFEVPTECTCGNCYADTIDKEPFSEQRCQNFYAFSHT